MCQGSATNASIFRGPAALRGSPNYFGCELVIAANVRSKACTWHQLRGRRPRIRWRNLAWEVGAECGEGLGLPLHVRKLICLWEQRARCPKAIAEVSDGETAVIDLSPTCCGMRCCVLRRSVRKCEGA